MKKKLSFIFTLLVLSSFSWAVTITSYYKPAIAPAAQMSQMATVVSNGSLAEVEMADWSVDLASFSSQSKSNRRGQAIRGAANVTPSYNSGSGIWTSTGKKNPALNAGSMFAGATVSANAIHSATEQSGPTTTYDNAVIRFARGDKATRPTDDPIGGLAPVGDAVLPFALLAFAFTIVLTIRRRADKDLEGEKL